MDPALHPGSGAGGGWVYRQHGTVTPGVWLRVLWTSGSRDVLTDHRGIGGAGEFPTASGTFSLLISQGLRG